MIRLEHLNLVVREISQSLAFYKAAFPHWHIRGKGVNDWYGVKRNWVHFGDEYSYLTLNDGGTGANRNLATNQLGLAHFAFETSNIEALRNRLLKTGYTPSHVGNPNQHRKNLYFIDCDGFEIEFIEYLSDVPNQRNQYL